MASDTAGRTDSGLRGHLAEAFLGALIHGDTPALLTRLGARATIDDPSLGRAVGLAALERVVEALAKRFSGAELEETVLAATARAHAFEARVRAGERQAPVLVVVAHGKEREVEIRLYYDASAWDASSTQRAPLFAATLTSTVGAPRIRELTSALVSGNAEAARRCFEHDAAFGLERSAPKGKSAGAHVAAITAALEGAQLASTIEDGRAFVLEGTTARERGHKPFALTLSLGDSGLFARIAAYGLD